MALFLFADAILKELPIKVFNHGNMIRDFTYVGDIVESIKRIVVKPVTENIHWNSDFPDSDSSSAPYRIFNIGNNSPVKLLSYIEALEKALNKKSIKEMISIQPGDVSQTNADTSSLENYISFKPSTSIERGIANFVDWFKSYCN
jgi:UDP-glucuronate 4-epimerase